MESLKKRSVRIGDKGISQATRTIPISEFWQHSVATFKFMGEFYKAFKTECKRSYLLGEKSKKVHKNAVLEKKRFFFNQFKSNKGIAPQLLFKVLRVDFAY